MSAAAEKMPTETRPLPAHMPPAHITSSVNGTPSKMIEVVKMALEKALIYRGKLDPSVLDIEGMSGKKYRYLINNIIAGLDDPRYLEVGSWMGSTFCSAIHRNKLTAVAIDNWSEFEGPIFQFFYHVAIHCSKQTKISVLTSDFRDVKYDSLGTKFNVYLFDGPHLYEDQYDALALSMRALDDEFIFIVDDWNWEAVRKGTFDAIHNNNLDIAFQVEVRTSSNNKQPEQYGPYAFKNSDWHNGYFIGVLRKGKKRKKKV